MNQRTNLELIPNQHQIAKPVFPSHEVEESFFRSFYESIKPELDRLAELRARSNELARHHWVSGLPALAYS